MIFTAPARHLDNDALDDPWQPSHLLFFEDIIRSL